MLRSQLRNLHREVAQFHDQRYDSRARLVKMYNILEDMRRNRSLRTSDVAMLIRASVSVKNITIAKQAFTMVESGCVFFSSEIRVAWIRALSLDSNSTPEQLEAAMKGIQVKDIDISLINSLLLYHLRKQDTEAVQSVLKQMNSLGIKPDEFFFLSMLKTSKTSDDINGWLHRAEKNRSCTRNIIVGAIQMCAKLDPPLHYKALSLSKRIQGNMDTRCYNYLLQSAPSTSSVKAILGDMSKDNIPFNAATFQMAIKSSTDLDFINSLFERAIGLGYGSSPFIYNSMVQSLLRIRHDHDVDQRIAEVARLADENGAGSKQLQSLCKTIFLPHNVCAS
eukprot:TRINITY_DN16548_c0_g1_i1.p1 TRINITY_DN16548_c0_g1~~TRINITY_DN16548_c0_g1_i1.p1  ORF type:complete len:336 (+),score=35.39 TRINITY_DN16548_c0_g1_i1:98-1105(+)